MPRNQSRLKWTMKRNALPLITTVPKQNSEAGWGKREATCGCLRHTRPPERFHRASLPLSPVIHRVVCVKEREKREGERKSARIYVRIVLLRKLLPINLPFLSALDVTWRWIKLRKERGDKLNTIKIGKWRRFKKPSFSFRSSINIILYFLSFEIDYLSGVGGAREEMHDVLESFSRVPETILVYDPCVSSTFFNFGKSLKHHVVNF